ncbi:MAG: hypothetical protein KAH56_13435 [Candidatus Krumholzibacteria bacterium]|nr:hypothetical protein [Candidatus Krumholzibacteria bacterium]
MARPEPGAVSRRPHHISSIAHLFLEDDGARDHSPVFRDVAVAAPGLSPISAFAAAGLALGSNRSATLSEDKQIRWSAGTFLARDKVRDRVDHDPREATQANWTISPDSAAPLPANGEAQNIQAGSSGIHWSHLGCIGPSELAHLESLSFGHSLMDLSLNGSGGLVWCLLEKEADHFGPSYILGRLVELIKPGRIRILLFPDAWAEAGRPGWLEKIIRDETSPDDSGDLARCAELVDRACGEVSLEIHRVRGQDNLAGSFSGNGEHNSIWHKVALDVMADVS